MRAVNVVVLAFALLFAAADFTVAQAGHDLFQQALVKERADGDLRGAIRGHWGFKPYDVEDIIVDLPAAARKARRDEILAAVAAAYPPPRHGILRYAGRAVAPPRRRS